MSTFTQTNVDQPHGPVVQGTCSLVFCFDVGQAIDLNMATEILSRSAALPSPQREQLQLRRRAPKYFNFDPAPVRFLQACEPVARAGFEFAPRNETTLYDFGGVSVVYTIPISGRLSDLVALANTLSEDESLLKRSREQLSGILQSLAPAISRQRFDDLTEDYATFQFDRFGEPTDKLDDLLRANRSLIAQILRGDTSNLSAQEIDEALSSRISYSESDAAFLDFATGIVIGPDASDLLDLIEFANVELLEMRHLDEALDDALEEVYPILSQATRGRAGTRRLRRVAMLQADAAILFEGVNNAIKLVGDHYLARFYHRLTDRLHHPEWDTSVLRKLGVLESIYQKLNDLQSTRRMEVLEWIIIILIAVSIVLPFLPFYK
ncbi:MAG: hypothetical protein KF805_11980 [Phycisphaeraceae bacterium]|nr:hypothetical protein [Phycisphaeraceae bacterium]